MRLEARHVSVDLGGRPALVDVSLTLAPGELIVVAGPNGAGKSTLLKALAGLILPRSGSVTLDDKALSEWDRRGLGRAIAFLPQERTVHWPMSVRAVVGLGRLPYRGPVGGMSPADAQAVATGLEAMDVVSLAERTMGELSGGERARVLVARALAQEARVLIADEPTAGLDPAHGLLLFKHFSALAADGRTVVVALHDLTLAARFAQRILLLKDGREVAVGPPEAVLSPERLATAYGIRATFGRIDGVPVVLPVEPLT